MSDLDPGKLIASFDSASVLHDAVIAALKGRSFPHLGAPRWQALAIRAGGHLPWPILRQIYTRIGAAEGIDPQRLGDVDLAAVAQWFADQVPDRRYPAIMIGSSNGALAHLAAALDVPWLPDTVLVPVAHADDPDRADDVLEFGAQVAPALLERNPDIGLHHMHDPLQDELMSRWMSYFRVKWRALPTAYADLVRSRLRPGGQVIMVDDTSTWPVTRVAERHVFQAGGRGGAPPKDYLSRAHTPSADETAPEAEWGLDRSFAADLTRWCETASVPLIKISYDGPQAPAAAVAETMRDWYRSRGEAADRLVVPSFVLGDPWNTVNAAAVPFWTFFAVQPARPLSTTTSARRSPIETCICSCSSTAYSPRASPPRPTSPTPSADTAPSRISRLSTSASSRTTSAHWPATDRLSSGCRGRVRRGRRYR